MDLILNMFNIASWIQPSSSAVEPKRAAHFSALQLVGWLSPTSLSSYRMLSSEIVTVMLFDDDRDRQSPVKWLYLCRFWPSDGSV